MPWNAPTATPRDRPVSIAHPGGNPQKLQTYPVKAAVMPMTEPTDKSIPAVIITNVIPPATIPIAAELFKIVIKLVGWKNGLPEVEASMVAVERLLDMAKSPREEEDDKKKSSGDKSAPPEDKETDFQDLPIPFPDDPFKKDVDESKIKLTSSICSCIF